MSVLSFPRIFFQGFMCWDIPTGNNNDQFPTYAYDKAALNWPYLKQFGIDEKNFRTTFPNWFTSEQAYHPNPNDPNETKYSPPAEWNFFGTNACYFVQYENIADGIIRKSRITGGATAYKTPVSQDALFGKPIALIGDLFGSPDNARPARLVDNNPASSYSSQIYFNSMSFGDGQTGISGPCYRRMHSRFIGTLRNPNLPSAGHVSVTWQTCFPKDGLVINPGTSTLLQTLQNMIASGQAKGVMVRFNTYLNLYFQNGYFNSSPRKPHTLTDQPAIYKDGLATGNQLVNPCYSRVLGVIGPWYNDEIVSVPEGRFLATNAALPFKQSPIAHPIQLTASVIKGGPPPDLAAPAAVAGPNINVPPAQPTGAVQLGVAFAEIDYTKGIVSLDALNTFPESFWQGDKVDLGTVTLAVQDGQGPPTTIATLAYTDYNQPSYETNGGIIDIKFDPDPNGPAQKLKNGTLVVTAVAATSPPTVVKALVEKPWSANTDDRGIYLNEGESKTFDVSVFFKGKRASNAKLMIAKYAPDLTSGYVGPPVLAIAANASQIVNVTNGQTQTVSTDGTNPIQTNVTVVDVDANGVAHVNITAASAGLPVLMFYPFQAGTTLPQPQQEFDTQAIPSGVSFYTTIRVLSFDDDFVDRFINIWNSPPAPAKPYDPANAWNFVYNNILYLYDMIFPVMLRFVPLGDRQRVEAAIDQVLTLIAPSYFAESTLAMPITRDLSEGKRTVLQLWGGLVKKNYPPQPISKPAVPVA